MGALRLRRNDPIFEDAQQGLLSKRLGVGAIRVYDDEIIGICIRHARDREVATPAFWQPSYLPPIKGSVMHISKETISTVKSTLMGAAAGAVALAILGFGWGGWVTGGTAKKIADLKASTAVVLALAPICVDKFRHQPDAGAQLVSLQKLSSYDQTGFVQKGGWASTLGGKEDSSAITQACAQSLAKLTAADLG
jgi:hypothetical protein